ncbi:MAG: hypothetical protein L0271_19580 [Gemmatimonadetes bacterium]|nr:hypothetical protein [Gemmatimonadota bacterium]
MAVVLFIGTRRGLFIARAVRAREAWQFSAPRLVGREVYWAARDPRDGAVWAATRHNVWGAHLHRSFDLGETWDVCEAIPHHHDARGVDAVWCIAPGPPAEPDTLYAGIEPAGLFRSTDGGATWAPVAGLNEHPATSTWQPAGGALALHSIHIDARDPLQLWCAVSAGGVYRSDDGGTTWLPKNSGVRADFQPGPSPAAGQCVHKLILHPARADRLYQQNHCGTWRSDDAGDSWTEITPGLPTDFGYVLATDPRDADVLFVIPEESSHMRTTVGGRLRVYRTRDAGASWTALEKGLPQQNAWVSLLREGMTNDSLDPVGVYFGTSSGHLFASRDAGEHWTLIAGFLPRILSVHAAVVDD